MVFLFIMPLQEHVEDGDVAMVGESQVAYAALLLLFHEPVEYAVVDKALVELFFRILSSADGMEQQIVDVFHLQFLQRVLEHLDACSTCAGLW